MRNVAFFALLSLAACGGHDFTGTWTGAVERTTISSGAKVASAETWVIDDMNEMLQRTRGAEGCTLTLEAGCPNGCFDLVIAPGQTCTLDGTALQLRAGSMAWSSAETTISLEWTTAADTNALVVTEQGVMDQQ